MSRDEIVVLALKIGLPLAFARDPAVQLLCHAVAQKVQAQPFGDPVAWRLKGEKFTVSGAKPHEKMIEKWEPLGLVNPLPDDCKVIARRPLPSMLMAGFIAADVSPADRIRLFEAMHDAAPHYPIGE